MLSVLTDAAGIEIRGIQTMGGKGVSDVFLTDYVPEERVLGQVDGGWMQLMAGLNVERLILAGERAPASPSRRSTTRSPTSRSASSSGARSARSRR